MRAGSRLDDLSTPALVVDRDALERNLATMAGAWPGHRLRPHVKAHRTSGLARRQAELGHTGFTCATIREVEVMAAAGLGEDLLLANHFLFSMKDGAPLPAVGDRVRLVPAHIDPTCALHERMWVVDGEDVVDCWPVDMGGW